MNNKNIIYNMFFNEEKSTIEIASELSVSKQYISKVLKNEFLEEYKLEKEKRKAQNREKRIIGNQDNYSSFVYREKPLMPCETMGTIAFIKANRQSYITDKKTGELIFDRSRGDVSKDLPKRYDPSVY